MKDQYPTLARAAHLLALANGAFNRDNPETEEQVVDRMLRDTFIAEVEELAVPTDHRPVHEKLRRAEDELFNLSEHDLNEACNGDNTGVLSTLSSDTNDILERLFDLI